MSFPIYPGLKGGYCIKGIHTHKNEKQEFLYLIFAKIMSEEIKKSCDETMSGEKNKKC